jgi:hypothetical protein
MTRTIPGAVVDCVAPQASRLGPPAAGIEHRKRGVVGEDLGRGQHRADDQVVQWCQPPTRAANPVRQGRTVQLDALTLEHLRLAVKRQGIRIFADHHVRDQRLRRHSAINGAIRRRRYEHDILAGAARITRTPGHPDPQLRRGDVELFGAQFADGMQNVAAAGAISAPDIDHHFVTRQVRR